MRDVFFFALTHKSTRQKIRSSELEKNTKFRRMKDPEMYLQHLCARWGCQGFGVRSQECSHIHTAKVA